MATYNFTGTNGDTLPAGLTVQAGSFEIQNNRAQAVGVAPSGGHTVTQPSTADGVVSMQYYPRNQPSGVDGFCIRFSDQSNMLQVLVTPSNGLVRIFRRQGGTGTEIGTSGTIPSYSSSGNYFIECTFTGTSISVTVDGNPVASATSSFNQTETLHGIRAGASTAQFDNLTIPDVVASDNITITTDSPVLTQRNLPADSKSVSLDVEFTGSPTTIERNVNGAGWVDIGPKVSPFTDVLTYNTGENDVQYRFSNDTGVVSNTVDVVVGAVIVGSGQSNMSGRGFNNQIFSNSPGGIASYLLGNDDITRVLVDPTDVDTSQVDAISADGTAGGSWFVRFTHYWLQDNEVPLIYIPCAKGGTSIGEWQKDSTDRISGLNLYESMTRRIALTGGCEVVFCNGGGRDANDVVGTTATVYQAELEQFANDIQADFGVLTFVIPINQITVAGYNGNGTTTGQAAIRQAQVDAAAANVNILIGPPLDDIDLSSVDGLHFQTDLQLDTVASRMYTSYDAQTQPQPPVTPPLEPSGHGVVFPSAESYAASLAATVTVMYQIQDISVRIDALDSLGTFQLVKLYPDEGYGVHYRSAVDLIQNLYSLANRVTVLGGPAFPSVDIIGSEGYGVHYRSMAEAVQLLEAVDEALVILEG